MTSRFHRIAIVVPSYGVRRTDEAEALQRDLAATLQASSIEVVYSDFRTLPEADFLVASADLATAMESVEREVSWFEHGQRRSISLTGPLVVGRERCRRIALYGASYVNSLRFLDTYHFAAAITEQFGDRRVDGLRDIGQLIGAREIMSPSRMAWHSKSYTTLEHDACATSGELLARYLQAYDPDLPHSFRSTT